MVQVPLKDYSYANARVRAMTSRLLDEHVFKSLLDAPDYNAILGILEDTEYKEDIEHFILEGARPTTIDRAFNRNLVSNFSKIKEFFVGEPEEMVNALLSRWDLYNLKTILRGMRALVPKTEITRNLVPIGSLDLVVLEEIIDQPDLRGSLDAIVMFSPQWLIPYGQAITAHLGEYLHDHDLSILELALDKFHYGQLDEIVGKRDNNSTLVREVINLEVDSLNIVTLMRMCGLDLEAANIEDYYVPGGALTDHDFVKIMELGQPEQVYTALLKKTPYRSSLEKAWGRFEEYEEVAFQDEMEKYVIRTCMHISQDPLGIGVIIEYMWKKYLEIVNLRIIVRGKSIGLIGSQISKELYLLEEESREK